ncbi:MAG: hypothetical protein GY938_16790 [Ketobacter sp.]|nr:hypothetical protein [Ketobacter sp.]
MNLLTELALCFCGLAVIVALILPMFSSRITARHQDLTTYGMEDIADE